MHKITTATIIIQVTRALGSFANRRTIYPQNCLIEEFMGRVDALWKAQDIPPDIHICKDEWASYYSPDAYVHVDRSSTKLSAMP